MTPLSFSINLDMAEEHPGGMLYLFLAHLESFLVEQLHISKGLSKEDAVEAVEHLWAHAINLDPLWRDTSAALSAGPRDFAGFAAARARCVRLLPEQLRRLLSHYFPDGVLTIECRGLMMVEWAPDGTILKDAGIILTQPPKDE